MFARLLILCLLILPANLYALDVERFSPPFDNRGVFTLLESRTLRKNQWSAGFSLGYSRDPLELADTVSGARVDALVNYQVGSVITGAYGVNDWFTAGISIPFFPNLEVEPIGSDDTQSEASFGDLGVSAKFHLWDRETGKVKMGVAISPFLTFPSGSEEDFTGDAAVTGGVRAAADLEFLKNTFVTNLGLRFREEEDLLNLAVGQELLFGAGYHRPVWEEADLSALTELNGSVVLSGDSSGINRVPLEWLFGARKGFMEKILQVSLGGGVGLTSGYGAPTFRIFSAISYTVPVIEHVEEKRELARVEEGKIVIFEPIHFETAKAAIRPVSYPVLQEVADILQKDPRIRLVHVKGHTDYRGTDAYNLRLSQRRAVAVLAKLTEFGVEPPRLKGEGFGESQPVTLGTDAESLAKNRRVEFHIVELQKPPHAVE